MSGNDVQLGDPRDEDSPSEPPQAWDGSGREDQGQRARPQDGRPAVRVVRPGGGNRGGGQGVPPVPMTPPNALPPWLAPAGADAPAPPGTVDLGGSLAPEEAALRELMHRSVAALQPTPTALAQLRHAVPQRRLRRRQAAGSVALALALGVIGAAALHSAAGSDETAEGAQGPRGYQNAGTSTPTQGGGGGTGGSPSTALAGPGNPDSGNGAASLLPSSPGSGFLLSPPGAGQSGSSGLPWSQLSPSAVSPSGSATAAAAECGRGQLGGGAGTVGTAGSDGTVYGSFSVTNTSTSACQVSTPGVVALISTVGTDPARISFVQHTAGDPATGLPVPAATATPVVLRPGHSYVVQFAWVPAIGPNAPSCATTTASASASAPTGNATGTGSGGGSPAGSGSGAGTSGTAPAVPNVTIGHVPGAGGAVAASVTVPGACAGTVYRTVPLPGS
ncbi:hypothetical protein [Streptacidiphilus sp. EB129]|uniref:hypothetical protein n=1 Tax=Streptacidiphilus sp. EB129 TaxID=3156262 RepID=UPI003510E47E